MVSECAVALARYENPNNTRYQAANAVVADHARRIARAAKQLAWLNEQGANGTLKDEDVQRRGLAILAELRGKLAHYGLAPHWQTDPRGYALELCETGVGLGSRVIWSGG